MSDELKEKLVAPLLIMGIHLIDRIFGKLVDSVNVDEIIDNAEKRIEESKRKRFPRIKKLLKRVRERKNDTKRKN